MTSRDASGDVIEVLWEVGESIGPRLSVAQQIAVARVLTPRAAEGITPAEVRDAFRENGLDRPSAAYATAVATKVGGLLPGRGLLEVLLDYRGFAIRSLSRQFGGRTLGREEELRNNLLTYLPARGYAEVRTGRGQTDVVLPDLNALIEVKVWTAMRKYEDGIEELTRYIHTDRPTEAFMVVFGDREPLPAIADDHQEPIAQRRELEGLVVPVIVVPFEVYPPSKAAAMTRRRSKRG